MGLARISPFLRSGFTGFTFLVSRAYSGLFHIEPSLANRSAIELAFMFPIIRFERSAVGATLDVDNG